MVQMKIPAILTRKLTDFRRWGIFWHKASLFKLLSPGLQRKMTCKPFTLFSTPDLWLVGQGLDVKSSFCPILVQAMSNICPNKGLLQGLSSRCLTLSNPGPIYDNLDRHWTKITVLVHSLSFGNHNLKSLTKSGQTCIFDHVWTRLGFF